MESNVSNNILSHNLSSDEVLLILERQYPFLKDKIIDGRKLKCDLCPHLFPTIHPMYLKIVKDEKLIICYPCSYKRTGHNPHQKSIDEAEKKRQEIEARKQENIRKRQEKEDAKKLKQKKQEARNNQPNLF